MNGYLELDAQPAIRMPYTPSEDTANRYSTPTLMSAMAQPLLVGITAQAIIASTKVRNGASRNRARLAPDGITVSLVSILIASAKVCSSPNGPTTLGPFRNCMAPSTMRSP